MIVGLLCFLVGLVTDNPAKPAHPARPNVIFVLADDLGPGDLSFAGGTLVNTPNLDAMAKDGVKLTQYYSAAPICSPSRCGLITGQFPARWKMTSYLQAKAGNRACEMADFLDPAAPSLPRVLRESGYKTAHYGKWHLGGGRDVTNPPKFAAYGYDEHAGTWESPEPHPDITATNWIWSDKDKVKRWDRTAFFVDKTLDFLARHKDQPCFINLWLDDPHMPWVPEAGSLNKAASPGNLKGVMLDLDKQIGRLRVGLAKLGIEKNTLLIFTSDNGPLPTLNGMRSGGLRGSKLSLYEGGIRLPFIAVWPGTIPRGIVDETTVFGAVDIMPTIGKIAGVTVPPGDGEDCSAALLGKPRAERVKPLFWEYGRNNTAFDYPSERNGARAGDRSPNLAIRDGKWKLLVNADGTVAELYDLLADPAESHNLSGTEAKVAAKLVTRVLAWRKELPQLK